MSESPRAVFLSYARDDAVAARRIAEALRSAGLEVWFDENELRGGDQWDAKIRKQIDACTLFVPVISSHTQERNKGYFRLEWKLAVDQTHLLAEGVPFIAPVVIDDTKEAAAVVPPEFMKVQWSRLPGALPTPQFVEQVKRLLGGETVGRDHLIPPDRESGRTQGGISDPALQKKGLPGWTWGALTAVVVGIAVALSVSRKPEPAPSSPTPAPNSSVQSPASGLRPPSSPQTADKSIAVLPFTNMSEEKDNAFFADGIHEDILTNLALFRELRVVSRTSVMPYRTTAKSMKQIAQELGVTYILEGSVRRAGNKVRVTGQLIHAATDEHLWAKSYDRDLSDIFSIQSELAQAIADGLKATLTPAEVAQVENRPTENLAAYDLFLRGRDLYNRMGAITSEEGVKEVIRLLQRAVELDPGFVRAWATLATAHSELMGAGFDQSAERAQQAWAAVGQVEKLAPESLDVHMARFACYYALRDYARASEQNDWVLQHYPQYAEAVRRRGIIQRRLGRWTEALVTLRRAVELDPGNIGSVQNVALQLFDMRRFGEARTVYRRLAELRPEEIENGRMPAGLATLEFVEHGSIAEGEAYFAALSPAELAAPAMVVRRKNWAWATGNLEVFARLQEQLPDANALARAQAMIVRHGDPAAVRALLQPVVDQWRTELQRQPGNQFTWLNLALAEALLGEREAAIRDAHKGVELLPVEKDAFAGGNLRYIFSMVHAWTGDHDRALEELKKQLQTPPTFSVHYLRQSADWWPLRGDPRFEALLNDPKNNAPLF